MPADRRTLLSLAGPLLWTAHVLVPVGGWATLDGVPLGPLEASVLAGVWWLWAAAGAIPGRVWLPAGLLIVRLASAFLFVPQGFDATYFANPSWTPPHERSFDHADDRITRRDGRLQFGVASAPQLPLHFFHDNSRFNVGTTAEREGLPFSIAWQGRWRVYEPGPLTFYLSGTFLEATVLVDGDAVLHKPLDATEAAGDVPVAAGWRELTVRVAAPRGRARAFEAGVVDADGNRRPFGADVFVGPVDRAARTRDVVARQVSAALDAATVVFVALLVAIGAFRHVRAIVAALRQVPRVRPSAIDVLALVSAVALVDAIWCGWQVHGRLALLLGGDDMLTYATLARDIVLNGPLMTGGAPAGSAEPFYYQPLYPYVLALTHGIFGEDMWGILFVQRLGIWVTVLATWQVGRRLFGPRTGWATLAVASLFAFVKLTPWAGILLGEIVFIPLLSLSTWALVVLAQGGGTGATVSSGMVGGLATLSRSTLLPAWLLILPITGLARSRRRLSTRPVIVVLGIVLLVVSAATMRNWIVSGRFVPVATSFSINFELGNPPPAGLVPHDPREHSIFRWWPADARTLGVLDGAWHAPGAFLGSLLRKAAYTLGYFDAYIPGRGWSPLLIAAWILALIGLGLRHRLLSSSPDLLIPAVLAASHFAAVTLIFPHAHGDRLILPLYVLILPYAGAAVAALPFPRYH